MGKPKILFLSDTDISKSGGAKLSMEVLMNGLSSEYDMKIITPKGTKETKEHIVMDKYINFTLRRKGLRELLSLTKDIRSRITELKPDIIHVQMPATLVILNFLLSIGAVSKGIKIVYTDRGVYGKYGKITTLSINSLVKKAKKIITTTEINKKNYEKKFKGFDKYKHKFKVIQNTAGKEFDLYDERQRGIVRKKLHIDEKDFVVGLCGRYSEIKNWPLAYEILERINDQINSFKVILVLGTDNSENRLEAEDYVMKVEGLLGFERLKSFIDISNNDMSALYYAMDAFLLTSKQESFGRTAVEAMSRKNIVIGTKVDGLVEVIGDERYLYRNTDEACEILKKTMLGLVDNQHSRNMFYNRYHNEFGYEKNLEKHKALYENILKSNS